MGRCRCTSSRERYRLMVRVCLEGDSTFGIVLIKSGSEVGEPAEPHPVGTVARIEDVNRMDDGPHAACGKGRGALHHPADSPTEGPTSRPTCGFSALSPTTGPSPRTSWTPSGRPSRGTCGWRWACTAAGVREVKTPDDAEALSYFVGGLLSVRRGRQAVAAGGAVPRPGGCVGSSRCWEKRKRS